MSFGEGNLRTAVAELQQENRELCDENDALSRRRDELVLENGKLRKRLKIRPHSLFDRLDELERENSELKAALADTGKLDYEERLRLEFAVAKRLRVENAELRALARDMYSVVKRNNTWWDAFQGDAKEFGRRMRELGVSE